MDEAPRYDIFISYSHKADREIATKLQRGLERFEKPLFRTRRYVVFRDETDLGMANDLTVELIEQLDRSHYLLICASPESARSPWVQKEIDHWLSRPTADLCLGVAWTRSEDADDAAPELPPNLPVAADPLYVDLRSVKEKHVPTEFLARIVADVSRRDFRAVYDRERRRQKLVNLAIVSSVVLGLFLVAALAVLSGRLEEANQVATTSSNQAQSLELAGQAVAVAEQDPPLAVALAVEAASRTDVPQSDALRALVDGRLALASTGNRRGGSGALDDLGYPAVAISSRRHLAYLDDEHRIQVVDSRSGSVVFTLDTPDDGVADGNNDSIPDQYELAFSGDGGRLGYASIYGFVVWEMDEGTKLVDYPLDRPFTVDQSLRTDPDLQAGPTGLSLASLGFSPFRMALSLSWDGSHVAVDTVLLGVLIINVEDDAAVLLSNDAGPFDYLADISIAAVAFAGRSSMVATVHDSLVGSGGFSSQHVVTIWDHAVPEVVHQIVVEENLNGGFAKAVIGPAGDWVASIGTDQSATIWAIPSGEMTAVISRAGSVPSYLAVDNDSGLMSIVWSDGELEVVSPVDGGVVWSSPVGVSQPTDLAITGDHFLAFSLATGQYRLTDRSADTSSLDRAVIDVRPQRIVELSGRSSVGQSAEVPVAFSPDSKYLVAQSAENEIAILDAESGNTIRTFPFEPFMALELEFVDQSRFYLASQTLGELRVTEYDVTEAEFASVSSSLGRPNAARVLDVDFLGDNRYVEIRPGIRFVDFEVAELLDSDGVSVDSEAYNSDGADAVVSSDVFLTDVDPWDAEVVGTLSDGRIVGINPETGGLSWQTTPILPVHAASIIVAKPDHERLVVIGTGWGRFLTMMSGRPETEHLIELPGRTLDAVIDPTGTILLTGGEYGDLLLWHLPSGDLLGSLAGHSETVRSVAISANGRWLASSGNDGTVRMWPNPLDLSAACEEIAGEVDYDEFVARASTDNPTGCDLTG